MGEIKEMFNLFSVVISVGAVIYLSFTRPGRTAMERIEPLEDRVAGIETELRHLPDKESVQRMELAMARLEGRIDTMNERLTPIGAIAQRMQDVMLERGK